MRMPRRLSDLLRRTRSRALAAARPERGRGRGRFRGTQDGQTLVEFALIFPLFMILVMSTIEFALAFNAVLGVDRSSESAVLVASEAGSTSGADCLVLQEVDDKLTTPNNDNNISTVQIQRTNAAGGTILAANVWSRSGSTTCTLADSTTVTVPYTITSTGYPDSQRCNIIAGCPGMTPARSTVDTIGVQVRYTYTYRTPLGSLLTLIGGNGAAGTWTFNKRNVMRVEPVL